MARRKDVEKAEEEIMEKLEPEEGRNVVITVDYLRVRAGAGSHNREVAILHEPEGEKKEHRIIKEQKGWGLLEEYKEFENGWISLEHTRTAG